MSRNQLTEKELELLDSLNGPPVKGSIVTNRLYIIEWLAPDERKTGLELFEWAEKARPGWASYFSCASQNDLRLALGRVLKNAMHGVKPIVHFETHGSEEGIAPDSGCSGEMLHWEELNPLLQSINIATGCNLLIVASMCVGLWSMKIFSSGPCAPAACFVGQDAVAYPKQLLDGCLEFYREYIKGQGTIGDFVNAASREVGEFEFQYEPAAIFAFETFCEQLIIKSRSGGIFPLSGEFQNLWDAMFMINEHPENEGRFGINLYEVIGSISQFRGLTPN